MGRIRSILGALVLLGTIGAGAASADPANANTRFIHGATCDGRIVDLLTVNGAAGHDTASSRVFIVMGVQRDGQWILPIPAGQAKKDLATCSYAVDHEFVLYGFWTGSRA